MAEADSVLDGPGAKIVAGLVALICLGIAAYINWDNVFPAPQKVEDDAKLNPEFVACRDARLATVVKMKEDGVINEEQFAQFKTRAIETCAGQFAPGG